MFELREENTRQTQSKRYCGNKELTVFKLLYSVTVTYIVPPKSLELTVTTEAPNQTMANT